LAKFAAMRRAWSWVSPVGRRSAAVVEMEVAERLPVGFLHDEARIVMLVDRPRRRREAAWEGVARCSMRAALTQADQQ
jgi:hypothetical protein